jgi:hypothetical protein
MAFCRRVCSEDAREASKWAEGRSGWERARIWERRKADLRSRMVGAPVAMVKVVGGVVTFSMGGDGGRDAWVTRKCKWHVTSGESNIPR